MTISVPPDMAKEFRDVAKRKRESQSQLFRDIFNFYKKEELKGDFFALQQYGAEKAKTLKITEAEIEKLVFEGR